MPKKKIACLQPCVQVGPRCAGCYVKRRATIRILSAPVRRKSTCSRSIRAEGGRYHIETSVSISSGFSALTATPLEQ